MGGRDHRLREGIMRIIVFAPFRWFTLLETREEFCRFNNKEEFVGEFEGVAKKSRRSHTLLPSPKPYQKKNKNPKLILCFE
jgi:hypothetical protein